MPDLVQTSEDAPIPLLLNLPSELQTIIMTNNYENTSLSL